MDSPSQQGMIMCVLQGKANLENFNCLVQYQPPKKKKKRFNEGVRPCGKRLFITIFKWGIKIKTSQN